MICSGVVRIMTMANPLHEIWDTFRSICIIIRVFTFPETAANLRGGLKHSFSNCRNRSELVIIAHSMGGLVSRSACHYGRVAGHRWLNHLLKIVFLGTPHHGAPLERVGNRIDVLLEISPYSAPFSRLGKIRSAGITDLRYGNILDEDWKGRDRFECSGDHRRAVPLPEGVKCYTIAATTRKEMGILGDRLMGDGLVPLNSALGRHKNAGMDLCFPKAHQQVVRELRHMDLLNRPKVYETIREWLEGE